MGFVMYHLATRVFALLSQGIEPIAIGVALWALFCIILQRGSSPCYRKASNPSLSGVALLKSFMEMDTFAHTADIGYFIDPEHTGKGLGKQFLAELEKHARELGIKVLVAMSHPQIPKA
jgi:GNAT superfamily N-acetyltransferase